MADGCPRVVIVGTGMAGIAAASRLHEAASSRFQLTLLEASDRLGGRIRSADFDGERVELGATWIHGTQGSPVYALALRAGAMEPEAGVLWEGQDGFDRNCWVRIEDGAPVPEPVVEAVVGCFSDLLDRMRDESFCLAAKDSTVGAFLREGFERFLTDWPEAETVPLARGVFRTLEGLERVHTGADSLADLDMMGYHEYEDFGGEHLTIPQGYSAVVWALARSLPPNCVQFAKKVTRITWNRADSPHPVRVQCEDGSVEPADHVIVTMSLGVLKRRASNSDRLEGLFDPPLPRSKVDSIRKLGFGVVNKVFAALEPVNGGLHRPTQCVFTDHCAVNRAVNWSDHEGVVPAWMRRSPGWYPIHRRSHVLVTWFAGGEAQETEERSDEEIASGISTLVAKLGGPQGPCKRLLRSNWGTDPLFHGSYSYVSRGASCDHIDALAEPLTALQVLFAGEATHRKHYSTVHGAFLSGVREADRLLKQYQVPVRPPLYYN